MTGHDPTSPGPPRPDPRRPLTWADSPEEQALIAPWNAGHGAPLADVQHAAELDNDAAQHALAYRYEHGDGVPQDFAQAARLFRLAAEQGYAKAQLYLADAYHHGDGVDKNPAEAEQWYRRAAEQGNGLARLLLESRYPTDETHS